MSPYDKDQERIFRDLVYVPLNYTIYLEKGMNFIKFTDRLTGKDYQITIKELKK